MAFFQIFRDDDNFGTIPDDRVEKYDNAREYLLKRYGYKGTIAPNIIKRSDELIVMIQKVSKYLKER